MPPHDPRPGAEPDDSDRLPPGKVFSIPEDVKWLDPLQLEALTGAFRAWHAEAATPGARRARSRVWAVYLLLRYTGARLGEVLALDDMVDLDLERGLAGLGRQGEAPGRRVELPADAAAELRACLEHPDCRPLRGRMLQLDQGFVRKKFYERGREAGLPRELANASALRKSRAIELLRSDVPLAVVQALLGHSTASLTAACQDFSDDDVRRILSRFVRREATRRTSARNAFHGRVARVTRGDIQSLVELDTLGGFAVRALITNDSLEVLELSRDKMVTARVKAPWVSVFPGPERPRAGASNACEGRVERVTLGELAAEVILELPGGTRLCAVVEREEARGLARGMPAWGVFSSGAVILDLD